jgi:hypothetical protein
MRSSGGRVAIKALSGALVVAGTRKLARTHPKLSRGLKIALIVAYGAATVHNMRKAR